MTRIGALFAGYGGLEMAATSVLGGSVAWHVENNPDAARILAHHWPDVPNLGDITAVDWTTVEPVDVLTGGFPCQDVSAAGKRAGLTEGTRSGLWSHMAAAVDALRPSLVIVENVRGLLNATATRPGTVRDVGCGLCDVDDGNPALRALGAVLGDLADLGYDARWTSIRASDVGAPHERFRVFLAARPAADTGSRGRHGRARDPIGGPVGRVVAARPGQDPPADSSRERHGRGEDPRGLGSVDGEDEGPPRQRERARAEPGNRDGTASADTGGGPFPGTVHVGVVCLATEHRDWGEYEPAIRRWETLLGRPAPTPTEPTGRDGAARLSPRFVEWMMGLPAGWVTNVPGVSRNAQLTALGNGVVPQQAAEALRRLLEPAAEQAAS